MTCGLQFPFVGQRPGMAPSLSMAAADPEAGTAVAAQMAPDVVAAPDAAVPAATAEAVDRARWRLRRPLHLIVADAASVLAAGALASAAVGSPPADAAEALLPAAVAVALWAAVFYGFGLYSGRTFTWWDEMRRLVSASSVAVLLIAAATSWQSRAQIWVPIFWALAFALDGSLRAALRVDAARRRADGRLALRAAVVGDGDAGAVGALLDESKGYEHLGLIPLGGAADARHASLGAVDDLEEIVSRLGIQCLFVGTATMSRPEFARIVRGARRCGVELRLVTALPEILTWMVAVEPFAGRSVLRLHHGGLSGSRAAVKRAFDVIGASALLVLASPLLLGAAIAIKLGSPGPVFFRQERVTKGGRTFRIFKFRTMRDDTGRDLVRENVDTSTAFFKLSKRDPRITRVGAFLRRSSIDELPQLLNVVAGDMSLVGPRPLPADQVAANVELLAPRHEVLAGVTGWWQTQGRSDVDPATAVAMDLFYIDNWCFTLDLLILLNTVRAVVVGSGAR
jgi:exopolysaccharide biosynthesis polyprenyl glycosylphosphotransferase